MSKLWVLSHSYAEERATEGIIGRAEGGGGFGFDPEEYGRYGDSEHAEWRNYDVGARGRWVAREPERLEDHELVRSEELARYEPGDRVRAVDDVSGILFTQVPAGTEGRVVSTRGGLLTSYVTVAFANGQTREVKESEVKKVSWWG